MANNQNIMWKYIAVFSLGLCSATSFLLPFTRFYFYDDWVGAMGCTNEQAGYLMTIYAFANTISFIPGGWLADKYSAKKILIYSTLGTAALNFLFAWNQNYNLAMVIWFCLSITTCFAFWGALMKAVRMCGSDSEQGKMYGWYNGSDGLFAIGVLATAMAIYAFLAKDLSGLVGGYQGALIFQGLACIVAVIMMQIFFKETKGAATSEDEKMDFKKLGLVAKNPATWYVSIVIFVGYGLFSGSYILTPYTGDVLGVSVIAAGTLAYWRSKGLRLVFGPVGGTIADTVKSSALVSIGAYLLIIAAFVFLLLLPVDPQNENLRLMGIIGTFVLGAGMFTVYGVMFSSISEARIPRSHTGTTIGLASIVGYSSDYFYGPIFGYWIDNSVDGSGYHNIFLFMMGTAVLGIIACLLVYRHGRKAKSLVTAKA